MGQFEDRVPTILLLIGHLEGGGAERQCYLLARGLRAAGFSVVVVSQPPSREIVRAYEVISAELVPMEVPLGPLGLVPYLRIPFYQAGLLGKLHRICRRVRPTVVHAFLPPGNCAATIAGRLAGVPIVVASHRYAGSASVSYDVWQGMEALVCRLADGNLANSDGVAAHLRKCLWLPTRTLHTVYNGVDPIDTEVCRRFREPVRAELGLGASDLALVTVANLWPYKGHRELVRALSIARKTDPRLRILFIGADKGYRKNLEKLIRRLGVTDAVTFLGERRDVCRLLPAFDIYVSASRGEGMSNAIMEAMQHGLAVIGTRVAGTPELLEDGKVGLMFERGDVERLVDHIHTLATDESLRGELGSQAERRIREQFNDRRMVVATLDVYRILAQRKGLEREGAAFAEGATRFAADPEPRHAGSGRIPKAEE